MTLFVERGQSMSWRLAVVVFAMLAGCGETIELSDGGGDASALLQNGTMCGAAGDCLNGHCVDGVCCESACKRVCEACNVPGHLGSCEAVPDGEDPVKECLGMMTPDGGGIPLIDGGINQPDGGTGSNPAACVGTCGGDRTCKLPGKAKSCGEKFCNDTKLELSFSCNGLGGCELQPTECVAYSCGPDACKTSCTSPSDCLDTHYCNASGQCVPRKNVGVQCGLGTECTTGFCAGDSGNINKPTVCCNSACTGIPGGTCVNTGHEGQCQCAKACDAGVSCVLTYPDADGDGFGDRGYPPNPVVDVYCASGALNAIPPGRVTDNTDCYDSKALVYPGPRKDSDRTCTGSGFFRCCYDNFYYTDRGDGSFDYNCDGVQQHEQNEFPSNDACHFCDSDAASNCSSGDTSCASSGEGSTMATCGTRTACTDVNGVPNGSYACGGCNIFFLICGSHEPSNAGFRSVVGCGQVGTKYTCSGCSSANGAPGTATTSVQQGCL